MLPGLRILFAITLLSVSVVIFGLGAAAFLRSAHEDVANAPWRPIETPITARVDLAPTTLSMLRVEPEATIAAITARADAAAAAAQAPESSQELPADAVPPAISEQPLEAPLPASTAAMSAEPPAATQAAPPAAQTIVASVEPVREPTPEVDPQAAEPRPADPTTPETNAPAADAQAATVIAALNTDNTEQPQTKDPVEPASVPQESLDAPLSAVMPVETQTSTDTLNADDKTIQPAKVAALDETATTATPPLPKKEVRIPIPRIDPAVIETRRKHQQMLVQRARAQTAARARRIAAARARAARAAAAAAAAANPFGAPANSATTSIRAN